MKLVLVIPCFNEAANLPLLVPRCVALTEVCDARVILVDNGSSDETPQVLDALLGKHDHVSSVRVDVNRGYGHGILAGLKASKGDVVGWTHADMQTDPMDASVGLQKFREADDPARLFVKGKRYGRPAGDQLFTIGMSVFESLLLRTWLWDINAQPTLMPRRVFDAWNDPPDDFALDLFAYHFARSNGCSVVRYPVKFGERAHGSSHWNVDCRAKVKFIRRTIDYSFRLRGNLSNTGE